MAGASINDIKGRIKSVEGTMQITKAMELVATSKLRRAKERAEKTKPYMNTLLEAISVIGRTGIAKDASISSAGSGKTLYIVVAGDRGLAGGFNNNIFKVAKTLAKEANGIYLPIGKKAVEYFIRREREIFSREYSSAASLGVGDAMKIAELIFERYLSGEISCVKIIYTKFISMMTQAPVWESILPLPQQEGSVSEDPIYEEAAEEIMKVIIPDYIGGILYSAICESLAAESAARRTAMNSANKNAEEMIGTLVLQFNRARQAVITQEITEIISGSEAL